MSFLSDLFEGKTSNLGNDLSPSNVFNDTASSFNNQPSWLKDTEIALPAAALTVATLGSDLPALPAFFGADAAATGAADATAVGADLGTDAALDTGADVAAGGLTAADAATASALPDWLGTTSFGSTLDAATGAALPTNATLDSLASSTLAPSAATAASDASFAGDATESQLLAGTGIDGNVAGNFVGSATNAAAGSSSSSGGFLNSLLTGASNSITKNPLGLAVATGALGYDVLKGNPNSAQETQLNNEAGQLIGQGQQLTANGEQLQTYLTNGTLPPGQQAAVTQAVQAAKAKIIANAAANGQNTNPTQNSALAQDLASADMQGLSMAGTLETQLAQTGTSLINSGLNATGLSSEIYQALVKIDQTNNSQLMTAIASMAAALGGGTKIQIGGTSAAA